MSQPITGTSDAGHSRELLIARLLASLISLTFVGLGMVAILTGHSYGGTSKLRGAGVSLDGAPATVMGLSTVLFGLFPLALWFRTWRPAVLWIVACFVAAAAAFCVSIRLRHV